MYGTVADFLRDKIEDGSSLSFVSAYFTINAFYQLRDKLTNIEGLRFLFGEPSFIQGLDPTKTESKVFRLTEEGLELRNCLPQKEIARACYEWIEDKKVEIKSVAKSNFLHGKMYYIEKDSSEDAIIGSSNFTVRGLGLNQKASNIELNLEVDSKSDCADLKKWFDNLWESDQVENVKEDVLQYLRNVYTDKDPEFIYFKTLYHLFEDFLTDATDAEFAQENPKFQESEIWKKLYTFQEHGVQACIQKLKAYNGCIIADSVGLGKTFEALAIIKYFEIRGANVLVLCPKKLEQNWTLYSLNYNRKHNPFKKDNFRYTVHAHTDLTDRGPSDFDWESFDLVVIDESHNFRNRPTNTYSDDGILIRKSRYNKLLEDIIQSGCQTQVLMLSATPVNNKLTDLENQIRLITEDNDDAFQKTGISSIRETLRTAQNRFEKWTSENEGPPTQSRRQDSLAESLNTDFFNLLDRLTIARSRTHIERFYEDSLDEIGGFPDREDPIPVYPKIDRDGIFPSFQDISTQIDGYNLSLFNPSYYIKPEFIKIYGEKVRQQRENNLIGMMKVNFLKRLESSVHSFKTTLERTIEKINVLAIDIQDFLHDDPDSDIDYNALAEAEEEYGEDEDLLSGIQESENDIYQYEHLDLEKWLADLQNDREQLTRILRTAENITPDRDAKLAKLKQLISEKVQNPTINEDDKANPKVLVFTAFADTANYLYKNLHQWVTETLKIKCAVVTGSANKTTYGTTDFNEILTNFSPIAKERTTDDTDEEMPEIDLLIATDCISEGQNLQDCDYLINYDIHWNPVRIIQRFGRIDRIGSRNKTISLVNFWPTPELDEYINLKLRVEARMALVNLTATGYDNPLTPDNRDENLERVWSHRDEQLRRMQTDIPDFDDLDEQLNISQFTLDDFRAQLLNYLQTGEDDLRLADLGLYAVTSPFTHDGKPVDIKPGVIFCLKQIFEDEDNEDNKEGEKLNPLHPYCLVYVNNDGVVSIGFTNPKRILERLSALCYKKSSIDTEDKKLYEKFNGETDNGKDMTIYEMLLEATSKSIRAEYIRKVNDQLDSSPDALLPTADSQITEKTEFELVTWLVIGH